MRKPIIFNIFFLILTVISSYGQGFTNDPLTGDLVEISPAKGHVIFAENTKKPFRLRVLCYNIHHAKGVDGKLELSRIARVLLSVEPDLVALQ